MKNEKAKYIYAYILLQPIIDLIVSLFININVFNLTFGSLLRGLSFGFMLVYLLFLSKSKYKNKSIIYMLILFIFSLLYFLYKPGIFESGIFLKEMVYMVKFFYFPIIFLTAINLLDEKIITYKFIVKVFIINFLTITLILLLASITGSAFLSYGKNQFGQIGWFYAANDVGAIMTILFPILLQMIYKNNNIKYIIIVLLSIYAMSLIGTKTAFLGMIFPATFFLIGSTIEYFKTKDKIIKNVVIKFLIIWVAIVIITPTSPVSKNISNQIKHLFGIGEKIDNPGNFTDIILSSRDDFFRNIFVIYKESNYDDKLFGVGFTNRADINNSSIEKLIEMDLFDIFFRYGLIGFIIYFLPCLILIPSVINGYYKKADINSTTLAFSIIIGVLIAFFVGHVFGSPSVSIYVAIVYAALFTYLNNNFVEVDN